MTTTPLNFIALLKASPASPPPFAKALDNCVAPTRAEPGNVNCDLHRNLDGPTVFAIYEGSTVRDALGTHFGAPHFKTLTATATATADRLVAERKPFTAEPLAIITELSPTGA